MLIVYAQIHIWAASTPERPWPSGRNPPHRPVPFSKDDASRETDAAGVHRAVIVPPAWDGLRNDLGLEAARLHPDRFVVMGRLDVDAPGARSLVATWRQQPGMRGLRYSIKAQGNPAENWLWAEAEAAGVPIMVNAPAAQLRFVSEVAKRHPGLKLVVDHFGVPPDTKDDEAFAHLDMLLALAKHAHIAVKASSLPSYTTDVYPYRRLYPHIRRVYDAFGPKRMFWGTDFTKLPCSYRQAIAMFTEEIPWLTAEDKECIMGRGLCEWIGWKLP